MAQTTQQVGDILANAPIAVPTNFLQLADGIVCRCDSNANNIAGNNIVAYTATIPLATAPAVNVFDAVLFKDNSLVNQTVRLSEQYLVNTLTTPALLSEIQANLAKIFGAYLVGAGNVTVTTDGTDITIALSARQPVIPLQVVVDGANIVFI